MNSKNDDLNDLARRRAQNQWQQLSEAEREEAIQQRLVKAGVPKRFLSTSFAGFNPEQKPGLDFKAYQTAREWAETGRYQDKAGLLLLGEPGNGKTSLAVCCLRHQLEASRGALLAQHWNVPRGLIAQQSEFGKDDKDRKAPTIIDLCRPQFLILDDFGKHKVTDWVQQQFYALLDELWAEEKAVIITSNLPEKDFMRLDKATLSRILGLCYHIPVRGQDYRVTA